MVTLAFSSKRHCAYIQPYRDASVAVVLFHITNQALKCSLGSFAAKGN